MDHKEAIRIQAVDRYLLGEFTTAERQDFEEHFFSCGECSEDLRIGAILVDNSRAVLREQSRDPFPDSPRAASRRPGWSGWWSPAPLTAAIALLVAVVGYQNLMVIPGYRRQVAEVSGAVVPPQVAVRPAVRGAVPVVSLPKGTRFFEIVAEEVDPANGGYDCTIQDSRGNAVASFRAPALSPGDKLHVLLDTRQTPPGQYLLLLRSSSSGAEMGQYPFAVEVH
jgi:hypothetical protein